MNSIEIHAFGKSKYLVCKKELVKEQLEQARILDAISFPD